MLLAALTFSTNVNAQLEVKSDGTVEVTDHMAIGTSPVQSTSLNILHTSTSSGAYYGINSQVNSNYTLPTSSIYAICGYANTSSITSNYSIPTIAGVFGKAYRSYYLNNTFSAGIAGVAHSYGGIGVYGGVSYSMSLPTSFSGGSYAGYFDGSTKVVGNLTCTSLTQTSDAITKNNVQYLSGNIVESIMQLKPISFYYNLDKGLFNPEETKSPSAQQMHYGFIAQELKDVLPNIVYEGQDSILSINYIELIPILVKTIQELSIEVEKLKNADESKRYISDLNSSKPQAILYQNKPNPFSIDTKIEYLLPEITHSATLYIFDANGLQLAEYPNLPLGQGNIIVSASTLEAGMYLYSLVVDNQLIDTKRMILTK